ncbi:MAG TPA: hypothetical protein VNZ58_01120 [Thermomicrobiales bacterium]|nr:hypothetical protein [Thermomicrobiales bacterium]
MMEWEVSERRFVVPLDIQEAFGMPSVAVRVPGSIDGKIAFRHSDIVEDSLRLDSLIERCEAIRQNHECWKLYAPVRADGNRLMVVIGADETGSWNLISMYLVRQRNWQNRTLVKRER